MKNIKKNTSLNFRCPICSSHKIMQRVSSVKQIWKTEIWVNYCKECKLYFLFPMPSKKQIKSYYENEYYIYNIWVRTLKEYFRYLRCKSQFEYLKANTLSELYENRCNILEVGAGDGMLLDLFNRAPNIHVNGTEYNSKARKIAQNKYNIRLEDKEFSDIEGKYDMILMSHVFEHFVDIKLVLRKTLELLKKDGFLFIELPNSPVITANKREIDAYLRTAHIYNFNIANLELLVKKRGFEVVCSDRFFYTTPIKISIENRKNLGNLLMSGKIEKIAIFPFVILFLINCIFHSTRAFTRLKDKTPWLGTGDTIRLILRKKQ